MSAVKSLSQLCFGRVASGVGSGVQLNFAQELSTSLPSLSRRIVVAGQSVPQFVSSLSSDNEFKQLLEDLLPSEDASKKGFTSLSVSRLSGAKGKVHVVGVPTEASRHSSPYRGDAATKSLTGVISELIGEAAKDESKSVSIIAAVPCKSAIASMCFAIARSLPLFTRKTERGKDLAANDESKVVSVNVSFYIADGSVVAQSQLDQLATVCSSIRMSQALTDAPPNELNPSSYVEFVKSVVDSLRPEHNIEMKVVRGKELEEQGFGGIWNVGKGNTTNPPALVVLSYRRDKSAGTCMPDEPSVVLVGKGITYDTGGLALKQPLFMIGMKTDMTGSGSMFAAFIALVKLGGLATCDLHCVLCIAENSVGPDSMRNDDVIRLYSGLTVEVHNTDAEGRLVLGDGVAYAAKHLNPKLVVDMATLTGAQGIATGTQHGAVLSVFEKEEKDLLNSAFASGENLFPIVFAPEYHKPLYKSEVADMKNIPSNRTDASSSCAGWFVYEHLNAAGYNGAWAHIDMASPATFSGSGKGTGYGVGLICCYLRPDIV